MLLLVTAATLIGGLWMFYRRSLNVAVLGFGAASVIVIIEYFVAHTILKDTHGAGALILLALLLIALSATTAVWLTLLARRDQPKAEVTV
jgi:hypothetical protein